MPTSRATIPGPPTNEGFDSLLPGFHDWGTWWQGEIAGEYFVSNSNLISHQVRLHLTPSESIGTGLILYKFLADKPGAVGPRVTSKDVAVELDGYMDWKLNQNFTLSLVGAYANPGKLVEQAYVARRTSPTACSTSPTATELSAPARPTSLQP